MFFLKFN